MCAVVRRRSGRAELAGNTLAAGEFLLGPLSNSDGRLLRTSRIPAYLEANDPRNRDLYLRHGYTSRPEIRLPGGPPLWPLWRAPQP